MNFRQSLNMLYLLILSKTFQLCLHIQDFLDASTSFNIKTFCMRVSSNNFQSAVEVHSSAGNVQKVSVKGKILKPKEWIFRMTS